jgi:hypothetical protein
LVIPSILSWDASSRRQDATRKSASAWIASTNREVAMRLSRVLLPTLAWFALAAQAWADLPQIQCVAMPGITDFVYSQIVTCSTSVAGGRRTFRFTGTTGQWIDVFVYRTSGSADHCFQVSDPNGDSAGSTCVNGVYRPALATYSYRLTKTGSYTMAVWDNGDNETFGYSVVIQPTFPIGPRAIPIQFGLPQSGSVTFLDKQVYTFPGTVGDQLSTRSIRTDGSADHCIRLIEPDGTEAVGATCVNGVYRPQSTSFDWKVRKAGTHAIEVWDNGWSENFSYNQWLDCVGTCLSSSASSYRFVPTTPCRVVDTRLANGSFGGPVMIAGSTRSFPIPSSACNIPSSAQAYSLNVTVVPQSVLGYLSLWPTGQSQPLVSTLNSPDGNIVANAAIVPAGAAGAISAFVTDQTHLVVDINGYFDSSANSYAFYAASPCRVLDTRNAIGSFGGPIMSGGQSRSFQLPLSGCALPSTATAYSTNVTVVPTAALGYLSLWPSGQTQPYVSTLNSPSGRILANAAIVPAGTSGAVNLYVTDQTHVIMDANGYFAATGNAGALAFVPVAPCRIIDTRNGTGTFGGPVMSANSQRAIPVTSSSCGIPATAKAYSLNLTVVPQGGLGYLTIWPTAQSQPYVSTLNSPNGQIVANAAIVPADANGSISVFVTDKTHVILDINGYFAPAP